MQQRLKQHPSGVLSILIFTESGVLYSAGDCFMSNSDTAVFVFSFLFAAMLMIYLFGLYGVAGVLLFMFCAVGYAASGNSNPSAFRNMINGFQF